MIDRHAAERDGYALVRDVFEPGWLATAVEPWLGVRPKTAMGLLMNHPVLSDAAFDLIGPGYAETGEANVNVNPASLYVGWHQDAPWDSVEPVMPLWRFGVYFRDYAAHSGGLKVFPGSHLGKLGKDWTGVPVVIQSRPGDLVIWNLRTMHAGGADNDGKPIASPRNAVFFDYAKPGPDLERYKTWRKERELKRALKGAHGA